MISRTPKAFLFDLGGVVLDIDGSLAQKHWAKCAGKEPDRLIEGFKKDLQYEQHEKGDLPCVDYFDHIQRQLGISIGTDEMRVGWNAIFTGPVAGIEREIQRAKAIGPVCAFSNTNPSHIDHFMPLYGDLLESFDHLYLSSSIGLRKPDAEAFLHVADAMRHSPEDILFFDDGSANIDGAEATGMQGVLVRSNVDVTKALDSVEASPAA